jgi:hypothetical protein
MCDTFYVNHLTMHVAASTYPFLWIAAMPTSIKSFTGQYTFNCLRKSSNLLVSSVVYLIKELNF